MTENIPIEINWDRLDPQKLERMADVLRVLAHPVRLRIVELLSTGSLNVGQIKQLVDDEMDHSLVSHHLTRMRLMGLLSTRRNGSSIEYALVEPALLQIVNCARSCGT